MCPSPFHSSYFFFFDKPRAVMGKVHVQYSTVAVTTFCLVCFEAVARELDDVSNNRLK